MEQKIQLLNYTPVTLTFITPSGTFKVASSGTVVARHEQTLPDKPIDGIGVVKIGKILGVTGLPDRPCPIVITTFAAQAMTQLKGFSQWNGLVYTPSTVPSHIIRDDEDRNIIIGMTHLMSGWQFPE